jgi:hypothetical protein
LPADVRLKIDLMLKDGIPYKVIIERLGEAGKHLNEDNISNWRLGGHQDYVKAQILKERAGYQIEAAADIARESSDLDPTIFQRACNQIAMLQYMDTLLEHGQQIANDSLKNNPAKMITLINSICKMSGTALSFEKNRARLDSAATPAPQQREKGTPQT